MNFIPDIAARLSSLPDQSTMYEARLIAEHVTGWDYNELIRNDPERLVLNSGR